MKIKIAELRKSRGLSQQELADGVGVSFQTVSKWETNINFPDITMLPTLAQYFEVTVDQLLGLKPLPSDVYIPSQTGANSYWGERLDYLKQTRNFLWNEDYLQFLIEKVWKIHKPVNILDCGCGYGFLSTLLLPLMPGGSTYTGINLNENFINHERVALEMFHDSVTLICGDVMDCSADKHYDFVVTQAVLRHLNKPDRFLQKMVSLAADGGLTVCVEVNRELESVDLYLQSMDYMELCEQPGFRKMWRIELEKQGRDYSIGMKIPHIMKELGLKNIGVRMNDKVSAVFTGTDKYQQQVDDFAKSRGIDTQPTYPEQTKIVEGFMNHGMDREEAENYCCKQNRIAEFIRCNRQNVAFTHFLGLLISYGTK